MYVAVLTSLFSNPDATPRALSVVDDDNVTDVPADELVVGVEPSVV